MIKIGITNNYGSEAKFKNYFDWISKIDSTVKLETINIETDLQAAEYDGIILSGGHDVDPLKYGGNKNHPKLGEIYSERDEFELKIVECAINEKIPILGICRGLQIGNVFFNGTLHEDLVYEGFKVDHKNNHAIKINSKTLLSEIVICENAQINSAHHQGIKKLGEGLIISATSPDGVIEAVELENKNINPFFLLVQWHPERINVETNRCSNPIGKTFIKAVKENYSKKYYLMKEEQNEVN